MSFQNPAGLWLLLGIPALIIIYMIKSRHEDRPVSSTYIWKISHRFMKKRLPLQRLKKILLFSMQLFAIIAVSFIASKPAVVNGESCDYIVIIDSSASMLILDDTGKTRFEYALETAEELSSQIDVGHTFSVISAANEANYLLQQSTSRNEVRLALKNAKCTYGECNIADAISLAELLCERSKNSEVVFLTDTEYSESVNITVMNLAKSEWNVSLHSLTEKKSEDGVQFASEITSYNLDASIAVGLKIDGETVDAKLIDCTADTVTEVVFTIDTKSYDTAEVYVEVSDALSSDNSYALCRKSEKTYGITLVSASPLYLESALSALGNCEVSVAGTLEEAVLSGQDLYIFDGITPESYPTDGSVILIDSAQLPDGISTWERINTAGSIKINTQLQSEITSGLSLGDAVISEFVPLVGNIQWKSVLMCGDDVVLATKELDGNLHFSVISFDLHDSNLPMLTDFVLLIRNLVEYSVPGLLRETDFTVGDSVKLSILPIAEQLYVEYPDGKIKEMSTSGSYSSLSPDTVGIHTAVMTTADGGEYVDFFVHLPENETANQPGGKLEVELSDTDNLRTEDAISEAWFYFALVMLILILAEWGWYYREQY